MSRPALARSTPCPSATPTVPEPGRPAWVDPDLFPFASRFLAVDGHRIHYVDEGSGPVLLLLHPGPGWCGYFHEFVRELRTSFRCVAPDYPGFGLSVAANGYRYSVREHSGAIERFIETLGLGDITLLVHDAGGPIGLGVAARRPNWFRAFVLTSTFAFPLDDFPQVRFMLRLVSSPPFRVLQALTNFLPRLVVNAAPRRRRLSTAEKRLITAAFPDPAHRLRILTLFRSLATDRQYLTSVEEGARRHLAAHPALILFGEKDPARAAGFDARLRRLFPRHQSFTVAAEQHFPHLAAAPEMIERIRAFGRWVDAE